MFSTAFLNDSAVGSGVPRGGARGGLCHLRMRKFLKPGSLQMSNRYICANFPKIWGWVVGKYYIGKRMDFFTPPER